MHSKMICGVAMKDGFRNDYIRELAVNFKRIKNEGMSSEMVWHMLRGQEMTLVCRFKEPGEGGLGKTN